MSADEPGTKHSVCDAYAMREDGTWIDVGTIHEVKFWLTEPAPGDDGLPEPLFASWGGEMTFTLEILTHPGTAVRMEQP